MMVQRYDNEFLATDCSPGVPAKSENGKQYPAGNLQPFDLTPIRVLSSVLVYAHFLGCLTRISAFTKLFSKALILVMQSSMAQAVLKTTWSLGNV